MFYKNIMKEENKFIYFMQFVNKGNNLSSKYIIPCKLENSYNGTNYNFKFYLKRKFRYEMERFKKIF